MTLIDRTIELTEMEYQHQFDDLEKQMIREVAEKVAWEAWKESTWYTEPQLAEMTENEIFNEWYNQNMEEK